MCVSTQSLLKVGGTGADREVWCGRQLSPQSTQGVLNPLTASCRMRGGSIAGFLLHILHADRLECAKCCRLKGVYKYFNTKE